MRRPALCSTPTRARSIIYSRVDKRSPARKAGSGRGAAVARRPAAAMTAHTVAACQSMRIAHYKHRLAKEQRVALPPIRRQGKRAHRRIANNGFKTKLTLLKIISPPWQVKNLLNWLALKPLGPRCFDPPLPSIFSPDLLAPEPRHMCSEMCRRRPAIS